MIPDNMKSIKGCVPDGWLPLVTKLIKDLDALEEEIYVMQIKEKFGGLRFYIGPYEDDKIMELIDAAEKKSLSMCQSCGKSPASQHINNHWVTTLCEECKND